MSDEWQPAASAPSGRWVMARLQARPDDIRQAVKLGGMWWTPDSQHRTFVRLSIHSHTIPATDPNWADKCSPIVPITPIGGPQVVSASSPDEWLDIPDQVMQALPNRMRFSGDAA